MEIWSKIKRMFRREEKETMQIPSQWAKKRRKKKISGKTTTLYKVKTQRKIRVPGLRTAKRLLAFILMCFHFVVSQITWASAPATQWFAIVFLLTSFILADYLWKTRREKVMFNKVMPK